jgi:MFS family permease
VPACAVAPEALAAPYAVHIGQPPRAAGLLLTGIPAGTVVADVLAARLLPSRLQRSIIVPAGLLVFAPLMAFAASPGLGLALVLLVISGLGSAWAAGIDGLLIQAAPLALRNRALALGSAGLMFTQGAGFALWGIAGQYVPLAVVIPTAAGAGVLAVGALRPDRPRRPRLSRRPEKRVVHDAGAGRRVHDPGRQHATGGAGNQAAGAELRGPCRS